MSNKFFAIALLVILAGGVAGDKYFTAAAKRKTVSERTYPKPGIVSSLADYSPFSEGTAFQPTRYTRH